MIVDKLFFVTGQPEDVFPLSGGNAAKVIGTTTDTKMSVECYQRCGGWVFLA